MRSRVLHSLMMVLMLLQLTGGGVAVAAQNGESTPVATPAVAAPPVFGIIPLDANQRYNIAVTLDPGVSTTLAIGVVNGGNVAVDLRTYAANALTLTNGGFGASEADAAPTSATAWLTYPAATFTLDAGEMWQHPVTITVPPDATPGDHVAALVAQTAAPIPVPGTEMFRQILRSAMRVTIRVPGPEQPAFTLGEPAVTVEETATSLDIPITNTGNMTLKPAGDLVLMNGAGKEVSRSAIEMGSVFAGDTTTIRIPIPDQFPPGDYLVSLDLTDVATGANASVEDAPFTIAEPEAPATFAIEQASATPTGDPVQYADVSATMVNTGSDIPTANITLIVMRDGEEVERYPLAEGKALPQGSTDVSQRYIPAGGWEPGTWTFALEVSAVSSDTETVIATVEIAGEITVP